MSEHKSERPSLPFRYDAGLLIVALGTLACLIGGTFAGGYVTGVEPSPAPPTQTATSSPPTQIPALQNPERLLGQQQQWDIVYQQPFQANDIGVWVSHTSTDRYDALSLDVTGGRLMMSADAADSTIYWQMLAPVEEPPTYLLTLDVQRGEGRMWSGEYGVTFWHNGDDYYWFALSGPSSYQITHHQDDVHDTVIQEMENVALRFGGTNELAVSVNGPDADLFINGVYQRSIFKAHEGGGQLGVFVRMGRFETGTAFFDNFTVRVP